MFTRLNLADYAHDLPKRIILFKPFKQCDSDTGSRTFYELDFSQYLVSWNFLTARFLTKFFESVRDAF